MSDTDDTAQVLAHRFVRKPVIILHADVQGYSRLIEQDEVGTLHILSPYLDMMSTVEEVPNCSCQPVRFRNLRSGRFKPHAASTIRREAGRQELFFSCA